MAPRKPFGEEPTTEPDGPTFVPCPACPGEDGKPTGLILDAEEWGTRHHAVAKRCTLCEGRKAVTREEAARWLAHVRQGR